MVVVGIRKLLWHPIRTGPVLGILLGLLGLLVVYVCPLVTCNEQQSFLECLSGLMLLACAA